MSKVGDLVELVHFIEGEEKRLPAFIAEVKKDAHGAEIVGLHIIHTVVGDVVGEADAAKDEAGKIIGRHFVPVASPAAPVVAAPASSTTAGSLSGGPSLPLAQDTLSTPGQSEETQTD